MITIEQIDEFRKRTNSSYEDAKFFLEKNNGDILDAIIEFERTRTGGYNNHKNNHKGEFGKGFADLLQKGFDTRIVVEDKDSTLFSLPVLLILLLIPIWVLAALFFIMLIMLGYKVSIKDIKNESIDVHSIFQNINEKTKDTKMNKESTKEQKSSRDATSNANYKNKDFSSVPVKTDGATPVKSEAFIPDDEDDENFKEYTVE